MIAADDIFRRAQPLLGTLVEVSVPHGFKHEAELAFTAMHSVHRLMSFHETGSDVSRINRLRPGEVLECHPWTVEVLAAALDLNTRSSGLFEICVAQVLVKSGFLPNVAGRSSGQCGGRSPDIHLHGVGNVSVSRPVLIDLGGIAKGFAVDQAIAALRDAGVPCAMVNAGGDLRCYGALAWPVHLRDADGTVGAEIALSNQAIASSANLLSRKRRLLRANTPHIGPNGRPVRIDRTISVIAPSCMMADALTKVAMIDAEMAECLLLSGQGQILLDGAPVQARAA